jgi:hypothetical protein
VTDAYRLPSNSAFAFFSYGDAMAVALAPS